MSFSLNNTDEFFLYFSTRFFPHIIFDKTQPWNSKGKDIITEDEVEDEPSGPGFFEQLAVATETIGKFVYKNSYIFTNVVMMVSQRRTWRKYAI